MTANANTLLSPPKRLSLPGTFPEGIESPKPPVCVKVEEPVV